jgi:3-hydroxybutyryl-CoA dehydrogenase
MAGYPVSLYDPDPKILPAAMERIRQSLEVFQEAGLIGPIEAVDSRRRIIPCETLAEVCRESRFIFEAAPEEIALKKELLGRVEGMTLESAILCSNTSAISITELARGLTRPERFVGTHFWNPAQVIPCVEVVKGPATSGDFMDRVVGLLRRAGKDPVRVQKDVPGFIGNRLQHAMLREALYLVEQGICEPEELDRVVKNGFGLRLAIMGPLGRGDLGGLDVTCEVQKYLLGYLDNRTAPSPSLTDKVEAGHLGLKTGRGFYSWGEEKRERAVNRRDKLLLDIIKLVNSPE